mmetsp:Transcript_28036/g.44961  ORF Transcript_28036/g.44961 Transcript_28036/m.44961 type:complete len:209 (-) Transcript_28036:123-749(-)
MMAGLRVQVTPRDCRGRLGVLRGVLRVDTTHLSVHRGKEPSRKPCQMRGTDIMEALEHFGRRLLSHLVDLTEVPLKHLPDPFLALRHSLGVPVPSLGFGSWRRTKVIHGSRAGTALQQQQGDPRMPHVCGVVQAGVPGIVYGVRICPDFQKDPHYGSSPSHGCSVQRRLGVALAEVAAGRLPGCSLEAQFLLQVLDMDYGTVYVAICG